MTELNPCPFCGSKEVFAELDVESSASPFYSVNCSSCGAEGPTASSKNSCIELWNPRPSAQPNQSWLHEACERVLASAPHMSDAHKRKLVEAVGLELARAHARGSNKAVKIVAAEERVTP